MSLKAKSKPDAEALIHLLNACEEWGYLNEIPKALKDAKKAIELEAKKDLDSCIEMLEDFNASTNLNKETIKLVKEALNELKHS